MPRVHLVNGFYLLTGYTGEVTNLRIIVGVSASNESVKDLLQKAGVSIEVITSYDGEHNSNKKEGYAKLYGSSVRLSIREDDPLELTIDNIVKAGELVDEATKIRAHEINHPNFFTALSRRINGRL